MTFWKFVQEIHHIGKSVSDLFGSGFQEIADARLNQVWTVSAIMSASRKRKRRHADEQGSKDDQQSVRNTPCRPTKAPAKSCSKVSMKRATMIDGEKTGGDTGAAERDATEAEAAEREAALKVTAGRTIEEKNAELAATKADLAAAAKDDRTRSRCRERQGRERN